MRGKSYTIPIILLIIAGVCLVICTLPFVIIGAVSASIALGFLIQNKRREKRLEWLYQHPFIKVIYKLDGSSDTDGHELLSLSVGKHSILIEMIPQVKYTISEVNVRFRLDSQDTEHAIVTDLKDKKLGRHDFTATSPGAIYGYYGAYDPNRVVSVGDTVDYQVRFEVKSQWNGKMQLSLRITTQEFGRYPIRFDCAYAPAN
jgi:hypothetical protein